ncbi:hypothetical protein AB6C98_06595 [Vibrio splendidus]|uniref:hypothetical protein n=1 Tax=Vibrio artabrorum TaxID=446374 RepID=UPI0035519663
MKKVDILSCELGGDFILSPEYWYSHSQVKEQLDGKKISDIASLSKKGAKPNLENSLILDTANAEKGLLQLSSFLFNSGKISKSHKKIVNEGSVIISRLRSYLMQVTYIPFGIKEKLNVDNIYCSTEFYILESKSGDDIAFLVPWLLSPKIQGIISDATVGGHHPRFGDDLLMNLNIDEVLFENRFEFNADVSRNINMSIDAQISMRNIVSR